MAGKTRVSVNGYGVIGKRVADAVRVQPDMELVGIADVVYDYRVRVAAVRDIPIYASLDDKADAMRLLGIDPPSRQAEVPCEPISDDPTERSEKGRSAKFDLGVAEKCGISADAHVTEGCQVESTSRGGAIDGSDHRHDAIHHRVQRLLEHCVLRAPLRIRHRAKDSTADRTSSSLGSCWHLPS